MKIRFAGLVILIVCILAIPVGVAAQQSPEQVARLKVDSPITELRRINTNAWIPIKFESLVGKGDGLRTGEKGNATLNFFDGALFTTVLPGSEITLLGFMGKSDAFTIEVGAMRGLSNYRTQRNLDSKRIYKVTLPSLQTIIVEGELRTRIEPDGRSSTLNVSEGKTLILWPDGTQSVLTRNTGVRVAPGGVKAEPVPATSFETLDSALDGCGSQLSIPGDVQLNVRLGADLSFPRVGGIDAVSNFRVYGTTNAGGWYRIKFKDGYGWIITEKGRLTIDKDCAGLRKFPDKYGPEDGKPYGITATATPSNSPTPTPKP